MDKFNRVLIVVAHPDDAEINAGGTILKLIAKGSVVKVVVMTNGNVGINLKNKFISKVIRRKEQKNAADYGGYKCEILNNGDGLLDANIKNRKKLINIIKEFRPGIIITHKNNDYHVDHRNACKLVEDSLVLICQNNYCSKYKGLNYNPIILHFYNRFEKPYPFIPDVVVDIDKFYINKIDLVFKHCSQFESYNICKKMLDENNSSQLERINKKKLKYVELFELGEYSLCSEINIFKNNIENIFGDNK